MNKDRGIGWSRKVLYTRPKNIDFIQHGGIGEGVSAGELYDKIYAPPRSLRYLSRR